MCISMACVLARGVTGCGWRCWRTARSRGCPSPRCGEGACVLARSVNQRGRLYELCVRKVWLALLASVLARHLTVLTVTSLICTSVCLNS